MWSLRKERMLVAPYLNCQLNFGSVTQDSTRYSAAPDVRTNVIRNYLSFILLYFLFIFYFFTTTNQCKIISQKYISQQSFV